MATSVSTPKTENKDLIKRIDHVEGLVIKMAGKLEKIYEVVVGNDKFDQEGLIARIKKLETDSKRIHALKNKLIGAFIAGGAVWTVVWEMVKFWLKHK